jgi:RNA polymerase sigma-70 factor (ECF subfamily)
MHPDPNTDARLVRRCRGGEPASWNELIRRFTPMVYRLSYRMLGSGAEAEDAAQTTFMRMHRSFDTYDETRPLSAWVYRIAYNVCLRRLGGTAARTTRPAEPETFARLRDDRDPGPEEGAERIETGALLEDAMRTLSAQDRALILLRYREGLSDTEVAEIVEMPVNTVKTRLHRARGRLREILSPVIGGN